MKKQNIQHIPLTNKTTIFLKKLRAIIKDIPEDRFNMDYYMSPSDDLKLKKTRYHKKLVKDCGTSGCILGWSILDKDIYEIARKMHPKRINYNLLLETFIDDDDGRQVNYLRSRLFSMRYTDDLQLARERINYILKYGFLVELTIEWLEYFCNKKLL